MDTLQSAIKAKKIRTSRKQRISALKGGQGCRGVCGGGRRGGGGGNHYQNKRPCKGGHVGRGSRGGRGISNKHVQLNDHGNPPH